MAKVLLVTFALGEKYIQKYNQLWKPSHEAYCQKHGYDLMVLTEFLDKPVDAALHIDANNRLLVCSQVWSDKYDFIIYLDADILINPNAPAIHTAYNYQDKIGIVDEFSQPQTEDRVERINRRLGWEESPTAYYHLAGLDINTPHMLNAGVMVFQPKLHKDFLESMYYKYEPGYTTHHRGPHYQQAIIGYELLSKNMYLIMSNKWNCIWAHYKVYYDGLRTLQETYNETYFLHFAGGCDIQHVMSLY